MWHIKEQLGNATHIVRVADKVQVLAALEKLIPNETPKQNVTVVLAYRVGPQANLKGKQA